MKTKNSKTMTTQVRFTLALNATWSILRDPVLTKLYARHWKRYITRATKEIAPTERLLTLYGFVFNVMYHEVQDGAERLQDAALQDGAERLQDALRAIGRADGAIGEEAILFKRQLRQLIPTTSARINSLERQGNGIADKCLNRLRGATMTTGGAQSNWSEGKRLGGGLQQHQWRQWSQ